MNPSSISADADKREIFDLCLQLLASLKTPGAAGRDKFLATLAPYGTACHARTLVNKGFEHEQFPLGFAGRIPWDSIGTDELEEGLDGQPTVLIDRDLGMVWTPYWFTRNGALTHLGTNCFTLIKASWDESSPQNHSWRVCGLTDTARPPTEEDRKRLQKQ
ncbi:hypothetical protein TARUN_3327 [Trichoderma arundinaceum]|uniref:Uncharacterized protein n=1 Tax=Trichoderma arundinaceum TaxID=490622 RepID=A0A395NSD9_TRIAR|nr:hypothetical protein TARUN_3327 [Trichoderma arundinaceum]